MHWFSVRFYEMGDTIQREAAKKHFLIAFKENIIKKIPMEY